MIETEGVFAIEVLETEGALTIKLHVPQNHVSASGFRALYSVEETACGGNLVIFWFKTIIFISNFQLWQYLILFFVERTNLYGKWGI